MIQIDKNNLITIAVNFLKTLMFMLLFVLSFPFGLLFWPIKSVISKLSQPIPSALHASVPAAAMPVGQLGPQLAPRIVSPTASVESSESSTPDQSVGSTSPDAGKEDHAIKLGN